MAAGRAAALGMAQVDAAIPVVAHDGGGSAAAAVPAAVGGVSGGSAGSDGGDGSFAVVAVAAAGPHTAADQPAVAVAAAAAAVAEVGLAAAAALVIALAPAAATGLHAVLVLTRPKVLHWLTLLWQMLVQAQAVRTARKERLCGQ